MVINFEFRLPPLNVGGHFLFLEVLKFVELEWVGFRWFNHYLMVLEICLQLQVNNITWMLKCY